MNKRHILLCGERGAGKSTLIQSLLEASDIPAAGFLTKRGAADESGFHPIHIHPAGGAEAARTCTEENLIGLCSGKTRTVRTEAFDLLGVRFLRAARPGSIIVMDELGFMEAGADAFQAAVFDALDGDIPVLAAVKARFDVPFLNAVRSHPRATVYTVTPENRDALYAELLPLVRSWRE